MLTEPLLRAQLWAPSRTGRASPSHGPLGALSGQQWLGAESGASGGRQAGRGPLPVVANPGAFPGRDTVSLSGEAGLLRSNNEELSSQGLSYMHIW